MFKFFFFFCIVFSNLFSNCSELKVDGVAFCINGDPVTQSEVKAYLILETGSCDLKKLNDNMINSIINFEKVYYIISKYSKFKFSEKKFKISRYLLDDYYSLSSVNLENCEIGEKILNRVLMHYLTVNSFFNVMYSSGFNEDNLNNFLKTSSSNISVNLLKIN